MIENKLVVIKKQNIFDKGWALFKSCTGVLPVNRKYLAVNIDEVVNKITYAQKVVLILREPCLPRKIIEELKWVNKYADIYLLAATANIREFYRDIEFSSVQTDLSINVNYIGISGKDGQHSYFIADGFLRTNDVWEQLWLHDSDQTSLNMSVFDDADKVFFSGDAYLSEREQILNYCMAKKIAVYIVKAAEKFDMSDYNAYVNMPAELLIADNVCDGLCIEKKGKLYFALVVKNHIALTELGNFNSYISGNLFINLKSKAELSGDDIPQNAYILYEGQVRRLELKDCHVVKRTILINTMDDFIAEKFDTAETKEHNKFSAIARSVEYRFTLVPPLYDKHSFEYSDMYSVCNELLKKWKEVYCLPLDCIKKELEQFDNNQAFIAALSHIEESNQTVRYVIENYNYKNYRLIFDTCRRNLIYDKQNLLNFCNALNEIISIQLGSCQNSKIDDEIAGYERTIKEKEGYILQGKDILQNKRRVEILRKKIEDLKNIKGQFSIKQAANNAKLQNEFSDYCKSIINGNISDFETDSIYSVVSGKELSKRERLNIFVKRWLRSIDMLLANLIDLLVSMAQIDVPDDYIVFDFNGKRFIIIENEAEYYSTNAIRKKYDLHCVARR